MVTGSHLDKVDSPVHRALVPPNVLIVGDHFGYPGGVHHGVTTYFLEVLPALVKAGVRLSACFLRERHPAAEALRDFGIEPIFLSLDRWDPSAVLHIAAIARRADAAVLHATGVKGTLMARTAARMIGARTLLHVHDLLHPGAVVNGLHRLTSRPTDMAICVSRAAVPVAIGGYHVRPSGVRVVHNGIRLDRFLLTSPETRSHMRESLGIRHDRRVLVVVGRMYPVKGHRTMLNMMPAIVRRCPDALLILVGDGPERGACEALVSELKLQACTRFLGQRMDVPEIVSASDLVLIPSSSEAFSIAALEALACGKPVVGFGVGGLPELVLDGETGRMVRPGDTQAFSEAVVSMLENEPARAAFGLQARRAAGEFTLDAHVLRLMDVYHEISKLGANDSHWLISGRATRR